LSVNFHGLGDRRAKHADALSKGSDFPCRQVMDKPLDRHRSFLYNSFRARSAQQSIRVHVSRSELHHVSLFSVSLSGEWNTEADLLYASFLKSN